MIMCRQQRSDSAMSKELDMGCPTNNLQKYDVTGDATA